MNRLIQFENGLIGDKKSIEILSQKESAKILLFSDSHGKTPLLREAILQKGKNADCLVFLGDGSYDLTSILEESFSDEKIKEALESGKLTKGDIYACAKRVLEMILKLS